MPKKKSSATREARATAAGSDQPRRSHTNTPHPDLWIAPRTSLTASSDDLAWIQHPKPAGDARLLELADIALGVRKPHAFRRRRSLFLAEQTGK